MAWKMSYNLDAEKYAPLQNGVLTNVRLTNTSGKRMVVTEVLLKFDWMGTYRYVKKCNVKVKPGNTVVLPAINFLIDLGAPVGAHQFKPGVSYNLLKDKEWVRYEDIYVSAGDFIEIQRLPSKDYKVFVSHSNSPSDAALVRACKEAMSTCGLTGYFAEEDAQPGFKLWDKIAREIISSDAFLVLWTKDAAESGDVREEIGVAVGSKKLDFIVPLVEIGVDAAGSLKLRGIEYVDYTPPNHTKALSEALKVIMEWAKEKEIKKARREKEQAHKKMKIAKTDAPLQG